MQHEPPQQHEARCGSSASVRSGRRLIEATRPFALESATRSWWHVGSTFVMLVGTLAGAALAPAWPMRLLLSVLAALLIVRAFITYHDYLHGSILTRSRPAWMLFRLYSILLLTPPRSWRRSHNYHHGHVGQPTAANCGTFPIMTTAMWHRASWTQRAKYRAIRHPLTVLAGYLTIFLFSLSLLPLLRDPARHWDAVPVLLAHGGLIGSLWTLGGASMAFYVVLLPMTLASALGSYLFFAQHNFERTQIMPSQTWTYGRAALESSSYLQLNKVMQWFTGNIGFHHVHHLNVRIPFYKLPEAMAAIPELQSPMTTSLSPRDIVRCFRSCLWDEERQRMVSYREASRIRAPGPRERRHSPASAK
ncbi:MAG TPA: fatty acid desaturase [Woeseiaceae bacterium]|nr:fatty acid desaturase [Woeseiaceae bacterium]